jgi:methylglutaconyl-CoA hydratase
MSSPEITLTHKNSISTIEFYHPKGNSFPSSQLKRLTEVINEAGRDTTTRVIILKSRGNGAFCAGASFDELLEIKDFAGGKEFFMGFARVINAMRLCPKLIIARVQGKVVGGGVGLAAAADYTLATKDAAVKLSELALGIGPFVVGPAVVRKIGTSAFGTLAIDARNWRSAKWARQKGLYMNLYDSIADLDEAVGRLADDLAQSSPGAMSALKRILWKGTDDWDKLLEERAEVSGQLVLSEFTRNFIKEFKLKK